VWVLWVSVVAGSRAGAIAGLAAMISRVVAFGLATATVVGAETSASGLALLVAVSAALVLLGWIPGTAKQAWSGPRVDL
jgi:hypothetical protein